MLDTETKRRIDTARDILVGKVPDPRSQVEQITIALIYKFMDDMDAESEELGGNRKFFAGEFAQYGWPRLVRSGLGGHEALNLYAEAITRMPENPGIPPLFRDIFKNAFLPYRDPETLRAFLKIIDEFEYDHSERLGDAFEYLLSVLGSQGDAGQFRTPRHIIDFIVSIVDPKKNETILDPACGTAGFLISSYKHILKSNTDEKGHSSLTPDEKGKLADNFKGYDISPDMVRLSLVNLYLHGFVAPQVHEYDTLTSEDRWNDYADVILANPPFMSPKGGIRPHNRFSVKSKRSEVLFADYMAAHLTPNGRAGIIVPEGIIFQSQNAYKQLRKMLVEEYLVAVISLPGGVFNPYSGVKTSILILDKALARRRDSIGFFKVENDGFDLGAQRRKIDENDLPQAEQAVIEHLNIDEQDRDSSESMLNKLTGQGSVQIVAKEKIAANGEYNLSGERYRENIKTNSKWPYVEIKTLFQKVNESILPRSLSGPVNYLGLESISPNSGQLLGHIVKDNPEEIKSLKNVFQPGDILYGKLRPNLNKVWLSERDGICSTDIFVLRPADKNVLPALYAYLFRHNHFNEAVWQHRTGAQLPRIGWNPFSNLKIPLPPLEVQREIAAEIEGYQKVIDGAQAVVENYRPHITIDPDWPMIQLDEICEIIMGQSPPGETYNTDGEGVPLINGPVEFGPEPFSKTIVNQYTTAPRKMCKENDLILCVRGSTTGRMNIAGYSGCIGRGVAAIRSENSQLWVNYVINFSREKIYHLGAGSTFPNVTSKDLAELQIPLPPLETQQQIVAEFEAEQSLVKANQELVERMERKIQAAIGRVWNEDKNNEQELKIL